MSPVARAHRWWTRSHARQRLIEVTPSIVASRRRGETRPGTTYADTRLGARSTRTGSQRLRAAAVSFGLSAGVRSSGVPLGVAACRPERRMDRPDRYIPIGVEPWAGEHRAGRARHGQVIVCWASVCRCLARVAPFRTPQAGPVSTSPRLGAFVPDRCTFQTRSRRRALPLLASDLGRALSGHGAMTRSLSGSWRRRRIRSAMSSARCLRLR